MDGRLSRTEYTEAVSQLSPDNLLIGSDDFEDLPPVFQAVFELLAAEKNTSSLRGSSSLSPGEISLGDFTFGQTICDEIYGAMFRELDALTAKQSEAVPPLGPNFPKPIPSLRSESEPLLEASPGVSEESWGVISGVSDHRQLQTQQQCFIAMAIGDTTRDNFLSQDPEYVRFINQLSGNRYAGSTFAGLPQAIQQNFDSFSDENGQINVSGSKPGSNPSADEEAFLKSICDTTIALLNDPNPPTGPAPTAPPGPVPTVPPAPPTGGGGGASCDGTVARGACNTALAIADLSRDNLVNESEFLRFVNRLSSNEYGGVAFDDLPGSLKAVFSKYATTGGQINVEGSKPGQTPDAAQDELISGLCCETDLAIQNPGAPTGGSEPTAPPAPTPPPQGGGGTLPPTFPLTTCRSAMASSDFNRDDLLSEAEYVRYLNRLTANQFGTSSFGDLEQRLQDNYNSLALTNSQIDIFGTKPGQSPNEAQEDFIEKICVDTAVALSSDASPPTTPTGTVAPEPTPAPTPIQATPPPTFPASLCRTGMAVSDFNRDDNLDQDEFVRFLNRLTVNEFQGLAFADLESPLPETFEDLAGDDGLINILGSKPGQAVSDDQNAFLDQICLDVAIAISRVGETPAPTPPPTPSDGVQRPTPQPGTSEVFNAFVISNTQRQNAARLQTGSNRQGLNSAYELFAEETVAELAAADGASDARRKLHHIRDGKGKQSQNNRNLAVTYMSKSAEIYQLVDSDCPEDLDPTALCQTVYGRYLVDLDNEDPSEISQQLTNRGQARIAQGDFQETLLEVDPRSILSVEGVAEGPVSVTLAPTPAPNPAPNDTKGADDDGENVGGGGSTGAIAGAAVGGVVLIGLAGYAYKKDLIPKPSFGGGGGRRLNKTNDEDDDDEFDNDLGGEKDDEDDDDNSDDEDKPSPTNAFGLGLGAFGTGDDNLFGKKEDEDDEDDDEEEDTGKKKKKKKKKDKEGKKNKAFGAGLESFGNESDNNNNFADYAFEDPSVTRQQQEDDEEGSVGGDDDNVFGGGGGGLEAEAANAFGNNFFGSTGPGWGAAENNETDESNFFANSGFGDLEEGSQSGSESRSGSGSYSSEDDDDSSYHSGDEEGSGSRSGSRSGSESGSESRSRSGSEYSDEHDEDRSNDSASSGSMSDGLQGLSDDMDAMIEKGDWDAIANAADGLQPEEEVPSAEDEEGSESSSGSEESGMEDETDATSLRTEEREKRAEYRAQVEALVQLVVPDEINKVDAMMEQFAGREAELVSTLQGMQERSANQRARAAVHKSANKPTRADGPFRVDGGFGMQAGASEGAAAGTAAIAAASLPIPAAGMYDDDDMQQGGDFDNAFGGDDQGSYYGEEDEGSYDSRGGDSHGSRSYYSDEGSGPYSDEEGSYYSGQDSRSRGSQSYDSRSRGDGSQGSRSYYSDERSGPYSDEEGSYSQGGSQGSRSYYSGEEGSQGSRSYYSGEEGSQGSRSYYSGQEGSQGSRSYYSGEEGSQGSRSYYSGEEGSQGSRSYYSGEGSGSQGSRSYYSDEGSGPYSDEEGSYYSGEEEEENDGWQ